MACSCGESSNCGNCGRRYRCSCEDPDRDPAGVICRGGETCDIALTTDCVFQEKALDHIGAEADVSVAEILQMLNTPTNGYLLYLLNRINSDVTLKALFCQMVSTC